jgi:geranylgeranyl diphosphate synthase, type I
MVSVSQTERASASPRLAEVFDCIQNSFDCLESGRSGDAIAVAFKHHFQRRGKATRALACLQASQALGLSRTDSIALAASIEALHNASLILDDFQDGTLTRRGLPAVHTLYGGDVALGLASQLITSTFVSISVGDFGLKMGGLIQRIHQAVSITIRGQTKHLERAPEWTFEVLQLGARNKSGPLFALAVELPLISANYPLALPAAHEAGCLFGLGYQIIDDIKDREVDGLHPNNANLVNALAKSEDQQDAIRQACTMAKTYLKRSAELFDELPCRCGAYFSELVDHSMVALDVQHG